MLQIMCECVCVHVRYKTVSDKPDIKKGATKYERNEGVSFASVVRRNAGGKEMIG